MDSSKLRVNLVGVCWSWLWIVWFILCLWHNHLELCWCLVDLHTSFWMCYVWETIGVRCVIVHDATRMGKFYSHNLFLPWGHAAHLWLVSSSPEIPNHAHCSVCPMLDFATSSLKICFLQLLDDITDTASSLANYKLYLPRFLGMYSSVSCDCEIVYMILSPFQNIGCMYFKIRTLRYFADN